MDCISSSVTYEQVGHFSKIVIDYLERSPLLSPFYSHPVSAEGFQQAIEARKASPVDRQLLVNVLRRQYQGMPVADEVNRNIDSLALDNTFTIVTAHQPNIFTGYLYYLYKIMHVVSLSEFLRAQHPEYNFVPVFYMGSEDADLDELGKIYMDGEKITWDTKQKGAVGRMNTSGLEKIITQIEGELSIHQHGEELINLLKKYYLESANVQTATFKLIHHLFASYGVVVLIPDNADLKRVMIDIFKDDLWHQTPSVIVEKTIASLAQHYKVQASPREINLFYLKGDIRSRIVRSGGEWRVVDHEDVHFSEQELEEELTLHPERFSPNVILRGMFQEIILPNIAYIGGGGELAYWLELKDLFNHYKVPFPVILLRNSFLFIEKKWYDKIKKLGFEPADFFKEEKWLIEELVKRESTLQLELTSEMKQADTFYDHLKEVSGNADTTLRQHVDALKVRALHAIQALEKKILKAEKRKFEASQRQVHTIKQALFPNGSLQERTDNFMPYYAKWGHEFIKTIYDYSPAIGEELVVVSLVKEAPLKD